MFLFQPVPDHRCQYHKSGKKPGHTESASKCEHRTDVFRHVMGSKRCAINDHKMESINKQRFLPDNVEDRFFRLSLLLQEPESGQRKENKSGLHHEMTRAGSRRVLISMVLPGNIKQNESRHKEE